MNFNNLPTPDVVVTQGKDIMTIQLHQQRAKFKGAIALANRGGYDGIRNARQAYANLDHLLDHYPNGTPRDYLVQYADPITEELAA